MLGIGDKVMLGNINDLDYDQKDYLERFLEEELIIEKIISYDCTEGQGYKLDKIPSTIIFNDGELILMEKKRSVLSALNQNFTNLKNMVGV